MASVVPTTACSSSEDVIVRVRCCFLAKMADLHRYPKGADISSTVERCRQCFCPDVDRYCLRPHFELTCPVSALKVRFQKLPTANCYGYIYMEECLAIGSVQCFMVNTSDRTLIVSIPSIAAVEGMRSIASQPYSSSSRGHHTDLQVG